MSELVQKEISKAIEKHEVFFAFSEKQFKEGKKEGVTYVNTGAGGLCPKDNVEQYLHDMDEAINEGIKKDVEVNGAKKIIAREYFNHECQLSYGDLRDMTNSLESHIEQFPELFTDELIKETSKECFSEAVENDWF